ncbi:MAG TPA: hypothetical protein VM165_24145 [Planctomycetaceae bacterium]|nr:hypothetical protein [Planctomycetaceae bacterium]
MLLSKALRAFFGDDAPHHATAVRWHARGVIGANGERIKLEATRIGGRLWVDLDSLQKFVDQCNGLAAPVDGGTLEPADEVGRANEAAGY